VAEFTYAMAHESIRTDLRAEVDYLHGYDQVLREVNAQFDIEGSTLAKLIRMAHSQGGTLSRNRRKQFPPLSEEVFNFIEERVKRAFAGLTADSSTR
jgi:hypothetical protein